ncbi:MAG: hypothetical protein K8R92_06615 [Planctomycetes bacterium]|nr:hypothetical protein [Planctomycetota bacterium]
MKPPISIIPFILSCAVAYGDDARPQVSNKPASPPDTATVTDDATAPSDPFMVIGEVVSRPYVMMVKFGGVQFTWRPASARDYREYLLAIRVPEENRSAFDKLIEESMEKDRMLVEEATPSIGPRSNRVMSAGMSEAEMEAVRSAPRDSASVKATMYQAIRQFLKLRDETEKATLGKIDARCDEIGVAIDLEVRAKAKTLFEAGRWRARCSDVVPFFVAARIDIGLFALPYIEAIEANELREEAKQVVQQYWSEITPFSKRFTESLLESRIEAAILQEKMEAAKDPDSNQTIRDERTTLEAKNETSQFLRAESSLRWLPKIAASLAEDKRQDFIWRARELMFPQVPTERGSGLDALEVARHLPDLGQAEAAVVVSLDVERAEGVETLNRAFEELMMKHWKLTSTTFTGEDFDKNVNDFKALLHRREKVEEKTVMAIRGILTAEQAAKLPEYKPLPIPSNPFTLRGGPPRTRKSPENSDGVRVPVP